MPRVNNAYTDMPFYNDNDPRKRPGSWLNNLWGGVKTVASYAKYPVGIGLLGALGVGAHKLYQKYVQPNYGDTLNNWGGFMGSTLSDTLGTLKEGAQALGNKAVEYGKMAPNYLDNFRPFLNQAYNSVRQIGEGIGNTWNAIGSLNPANAQQPATPPSGGGVQPPEQKVNQVAEGGEVPRYPWGGGTYGMSGGILGRRLQRDEAAMGASLLGNPTAQRYLGNMNGGNWQRALMNYMSYNMAPAYNPFERNPLVNATGMMGKLREGYSWLNPHINKAGAQIMQFGNNHPGAIGNYISQWGRNMNNMGINPASRAQSGPVSAYAPQQPSFVPGAGFTPAKGDGGIVPRYPFGFEGAANALYNNFMGGFNSAFGDNSAPNLQQAPHGSPTPRTEGTNSMSSHAMAGTPGSSGQPGMYVPYSNSPQPSPQMQPQALQPQPQPQAPALQPQPQPQPQQQPDLGQTVQQGADRIVEPIKKQSDRLGVLNDIAQNISSTVGHARDAVNAGIEIKNQLAGTPKQNPKIAPIPEKPVVAPENAGWDIGYRVGSTGGNILSWLSPLVYGPWKGGAMALAGSSLAEPMGHLGGRIGDFIQRKFFPTDKTPAVAVGGRVPRYAGGGPGMVSNFLYGALPAGIGGTLLGSGLGMGMEKWKGNPLEPEYYRKMLSGAMATGLLGSLYGGIGNISRKRR